MIPGLGNRVQATLGQHTPHAIMLGPVAGLYRRVIGE